MIRALAGRSLLTLACGAALPWAAPAHAQQEDLAALVQEMKAEMARLTERVTFLEGKLAEEQQRRAQAESALPAKVPGAAQAPAVVTGPRPGPAAPPTGAPVTAGPGRGTIRLPGTDTSLGFGGYVKLDAIYNSTSAGANNAADQTFFPGLVPLDDTGESDQLAFSPRESRFWFKSLTPTALGDLGTYLEMDFYAFQAPGDQRVSNSYTPRMRHAYGTLGPILMGQTWSTFVNTSAAPELLDFTAPAGRIFARQPQLRWSGTFAPQALVSGYQLALEQPESTLTLPDGTRLEADDDRVPDIVARLDLRPRPGSLSLAVLAREIRLDTGTGTEAAWGAAISLAGRIRTLGLDNFTFQASYGNALGRYASINAFNDGIVDAAGNLHLLRSFAGFAAYQHWWSESLRSTVAYGYSGTDNPAYTPAAANETVQSAHVNLLWSPFAQATFGIEYLFATRDTFAAGDGELHRVLFSGKFNF